MSTVTSVPSAITVPAAPACGREPLIPEATIGSKERPSAPWSRNARPIQRATSASVPPHERLLDERGIDGVGDGACPADRIDLTPVLHRAERLDDAARRHEVGPAGPDRLPLRVGQPRRLESHPPAGEKLTERTDDVARRSHDLDAADGLRRLEVAEVGVERRPAARFDEQRAVGAVEAGQIADVDAVGDEERLLDRRAETLETAHFGLRSLRSASASR